MRDEKIAQQIDAFEAEGLANVDKLVAAVKAADIKPTFDESDNLRAEVRRLAAEMRKKNV